MKKAISLLIIGIILMLAIVGCSDTNTQTQYQPSPNQAVGGCGVIGIDSDNDVEQLPMGDEL